MINRIAPQLPIGLLSLNLARQRALLDGFNPDKRQQCRESASEWYADGYADGTRQAEERRHGAAWWALMGVLGGAFGGVVWRELGEVLVGALSTMFG